MRRARAVVFQCCLLASVVIEYCNTVAPVISAILVIPVMSSLFKAA